MGAFDQRGQTVGVQVQNSEKPKEIFVIYQESGDYQVRTRVVTFRYTEKEAKSFLEILKNQNEKMNKLFKEKYESKWEIWNEFYHKNRPTNPHDNKWEYQFGQLTEYNYRKVNHDE